jgi:hypothetical protein
LEGIDNISSCTKFDAMMKFSACFFEEI